MTLEQLQQLINDAIATGADKDSIISIHDQDGEYITTISKAVVTNKVHLIGFEVKNES